MMDLQFEQEKMNEVFTKYHIKGLPFDAVIHHFSKEDENDHIHDHPFGFTSHVLHGWYIERVYYKSRTYTGRWRYRDIRRAEGTSHNVEAETIHEILEVSPGGCYTIIRPREKVQEVSFYKFIDDKLEKQ